MPAANILVIGGSNIDIKALSTNKLVQYDSNPGKIYFTHGGVARNICENLAHVTQGVSFITALGDDDQGKSILSHLQELQVDTQASIVASGKPTPMYLAILDNDGEMLFAVNDMATVNLISPEYLHQALEHESIKDKIDTVVLDTNLSEESIAYLKENLQQKLVIDLVSVAKAHKSLPLLPKTTALKANKIEAQKITGITITDDKSLALAGQKLLNYGVAKVFITLGKDGIYYCDATTSGYLKLPQVTVVDVTGAGDAFTAGLTLGVSANLSTREIALFALCFSAITVASDKSVAPNLSIDLLKETYKQLWNADCPVLSKS